MRTLIAAIVFTAPLATGFILAPYAYAAAPELPRQEVSSLYVGNDNDGNSIYYIDDDTAFAEGFDSEKFFTVPTATP